MFHWRFPWRLRSTPSHLVLERKSPTANLSPLGAEVHDWRMCTKGNCPLCATEVSLEDFDYGRLKSQLEELTRRYEEEKRRQELEAKERAEREYAKHIASLDKLRGAVRMFRTWKLTSDGSLKAMVASHTWKPGENVSLASGGDAKEDSGFYGFSSLEELQRQEKYWWEKSQSGEEAKTFEHGYGRGFWYICGTYLGYGHVKISEKGGRVQKAIPEYIIEPDGSDPDFGMLVLNAAEKYGMKIVSIEQANNLKPGMVSYWKGRPIQ